MTRDDWRLRVELEEEQGAAGLLGRLGLVGTEARELEHELSEQRLAATREGNTVFVYAASSLQAEQARGVIERELKELDCEPRAIVVEHWLRDEERWDDEPRGPDVDDDVLAEGYAPWEVRIECRSHQEASKLADGLESDGYGIVRRHSYVIAGCESQEQAEELARRLHGEVEPGGALVYESGRFNPFVIFGGLAGGGTPLS